MVAVEKLKAAEYNPRRKLRRGDAEWDDIAKSIKDFGLIQNLIWNERSGNLIAGHQRLKIAVAEFGAHEMPCVCMDLDDIEEKRLNVIMNRVGEGIWDSSKLSDLLKELDAEQGDIFSLGFNAQEIEELLGTKPKETKNDPDDGPPKTPTIPVTKTGDHYLFMSADGQPQHHLLCGDSTDAKDVAKLMGDFKARMLFTDPPYGVDYDSSQRADGRKHRPKVGNDELKTMALTEFLKKCFQNAYPHLLDDCGVYVYHASSTQREFEDALNAAKFKVRSQLIWAKPMAISRGDHHYAHEPCFYAAKEGHKTPWYGDRCTTTIFSDTRPNYESLKKDELVAILEEMRKQATIIDQNRDARTELIHPTQKPTGLCRKAMRNSTLPKDNVLDLFGGSGSTLIACELDRRNAFLMEQDPEFCDGIVARYFATFEEVMIFRNGKEIAPITLAEV